MKNLFLTATFVALSLAPARASPVYVSGMAGGCSESATLDLSFFSGGITVTLQNDTAGPSGVCQALTGLDFTLSGGLTATLTGVAGQLVNIAADGTFVPTGAVLTGISPRRAVIS